MDSKDQSAHVITHEKYGGGVHKRNHSLDLVKMIAAVSVVLYHFKLPGLMGEIIAEVSKFSVPFFFMCSGYFCFNAKTPRAILKKALHICWIVLAGIVIYGTYVLVTSGFSGLIGRFTLRNLAFWLVFNVPFLNNWHMWFLYALIYVYIIIAFVKKLKLEKLLLPLAVLLTLVHCVCYDALIYTPMGSKFPFSLDRSAWILGLMFFSIGYSVRKYQNILSNRVSWVWLAVGVAVGFAISLTEYFVASNVGVGVPFVPFGIVIASCSLFALSSRYVGKDNALSRAGREISMPLYLIHMLVGALFLRVIDNAALVAVLTLLCSILLSCGYALVRYVIVCGLTKREAKSVK